MLGREMGGLAEQIGLVSGGRRFAWAIPSGRWVAMGLAGLAACSDTQGSPATATAGFWLDVQTSDTASAGTADAKAPAADSSTGGDALASDLQGSGVDAGLDSGSPKDSAGLDAAADAGPACQASDPAVCADPSTLVKCVDGAYVATPCGAGKACCIDQCADQICSPFQTKQCLGPATAGLCNACGTSFTPQPCLPNYVCDAKTQACTCKSPLEVLFVLDASGSMQLSSIGGQTRWQLAQQAIDEVMKAFPGIQYGLATFPDHAVDCAAPGCTSKGGCDKSFFDELNAPTGTPPDVLTAYLAKRQLATAGSKLELVLTPLAGAMQHLVDGDLGTLKKNTNSPRYVILISDGEDTCYAPQAPKLLPGVLGQSAAKLRDQWNIQTYPVGFGYASGSAQLSAIAQQGGTGLATPLLAGDGAGLVTEISKIIKLIDPKKCAGTAAPPKAAACTAAGLQDSDGDGWCSDLDCKDGDKAVHPGATETTAGQDDDCDGLTDEADGYIPPAEPKAGCKGIDFLFVIDNSGSMGDEQKALIQSFPGFLNAIQTAVPNGDFQVMVVDSDATGLTSAGSSSSSCTSNGKDKNCTCNPAPACCDAICADPLWGPATICNGAPACNQKPPPQLSACDNALGAGRTYSGSYDVCFTSPPRFMSSKTVNLAQSFNCAANVGIGGSGDEKVMQAMAAAVTPPLSSPGGCNAGFVRDNAILVVTFVTDELDTGSAGTPASWKQALVDAKKGKGDGIYVLGIYGDQGKQGQLCKGGQPATLLDGFLTAIGAQGQFCSICQAGYAKCFADAIAGIKTTCDNYVTE